jgi:hypothetical protein
VLDEPATQDWANARSNCTHARPGSDGASTFLLRKRIADDRETSGNEKRCSEALKCAGGDQLTNVPGKSGRCRGDREKDDAEQKNSPTTVMIA